MSHNDDDVLTLAPLSFDTIGKGGLRQDFEAALRQAADSIYGAGAEDVYDAPSSRVVSVKVSLTPREDGASIEYAVDVKIPHRKRDGSSYAQFDGRRLVTFKASQSELPFVGQAPARARLED